MNFIPKQFRSSCYTLLVVGLIVLPLSKCARSEFVPLHPGAVRLGGEIGRRFDCTIRNNLLAIDVEKDFLAPFRERNKQGGFVGLGMLLDATVRFAAATGDEQVLALKKHLIEETLKTQESDGYIGLMVPESRLWPLWDLHEMSYLVYGLAVDHRYFGEKESLDAACRLARFIMESWSSQPDHKPGEGQIAVHMAATGLENALIALFRETGDSQYRDFCVDFRHLPDWNLPIVRGRWGKIEGHVYAYLCRCLAQLRLRRLAPEIILSSRSRSVLEFLTKNDGLAITGSIGYHECWDDTHNGGDNHGETCATAYFIRFLDELLRGEGTSLYGDLMERSIYNGLFAAQSPDGRRIRYYTPFEEPREYFKGDAYCCPNNYRRIISELPGYVYYRTGSGGVAVNLYTESVASVTLEDGNKLRIRQDTDYPHSGEVVLSLEPSAPARFPLLLRIPSWCKNVQIKVNDEKEEGDISPGSFCTLMREWRKGDRVQVKMAMPFRFVMGRESQSGRVAVMRGPLVFGLNREKNGLDQDLSLRMVTIDPDSLRGPEPDETVHEGGICCRIKAWKPKAWYPFAKTDFDLVLTEYPDPGIQTIYFLAPNPYDPQFVKDELTEGS